LFSKHDLPGIDTHFHAVARISDSFLALWCGVNLDLVCSYMTSFVVVLSLFVSFLVDVTFCFVHDWLRRCFSPVMRLAGKIVTVMIYKVMVM